MEEGTSNIIITTLVIIGILGFVFLIAGSYYLNNVKRIENFQLTITELSDEQKCMHICGFRFRDSVYLDQYKFCLEKCDRISERENTNCNLIIK